MSSPQNEDHPVPELQRVRRALVVVDVVESVRLMQAHESDVIDRWRRFVAGVRVDVLPAHDGYLVKSLGDGMLLAFAGVAQAVAAAMAMLRLIETFNAERPPDGALRLRVGAHVADVVVDELDVFGSGVNLAARLAGLAQPGEIVVSVEARDELAPALDAELEDMGACYLKHLDAPVRCFRVSRHALQLPADGGSGAGAEALQPVIAVLPFMPRDSQQPQQQALGDALADDIIGALSQHGGWRVISRLSTVAFRGVDVSLPLLRARLGADFVIDGRCALSGMRVSLSMSVTDARSGVVLWATDAQLDLADFFAGNDATMHTLVRQMAQVVLEAEIRRARALPVQTLESYTLYLAGTRLLHRLGQQDFVRSRELLSQVQERVPRSAAPFAMLAKWHVMRMTQGWTADLVAEGGAARACAQRALQLEPTHAFALTVDGLVALQTNADLDFARRRYLAALDSDPQEPYAWAALAGLHAYADEGEAGVAAARRAIELSPLDPQRFMFDTYHAVALAVAGHFVEAAQAARASLKLNRCLTASYRILAVAQALAGDVAAARSTVDQLLALSPQESLSAFERRYPGRHAAYMDRHLLALKAAGLPA